MNRRHHHSVYGVWYVGPMVSKYLQNLLICQDSLQQMLFSEKEVVDIPMATTVTIFVWFYDLDRLLWWRSSLLQKVNYDYQTGWSIIYAASHWLVCGSAAPISPFFFFYKSHKHHVSEKLRDFLVPCFECDRIPSFCCHLCCSPAPTL